MGWLSGIATGIVAGWVLRWWIVDMLDLSSPEEQRAYDHGFIAGYEQADHDHDIARVMSSADVERTQAAIERARGLHG